MDNPTSSFEQGEDFLYKNINSIYVKLTMIQIGVPTSSMKISILYLKSFFTLKNLLTSSPYSFGIGRLFYG
ncbi:hypothetical protein LD39_18575 [Halobacillus sp. BBL2006]|nr:hypothetical protein LD39_18575 [Halobacillus sp. BBL2006]